MKKLTKTQVKSIAKKQDAVKVWLCPSKCFPNPDSPFNIAIEKEFTADDVKTDTFDSFVTTFGHYNCTAETGKTVHYYLIEA